MNSKLVAAAAAALLMLGACSRETPPPAPAPVASPVAVVNEVADAYYEHVMSTTPETAYFSGIDLERHDGLADNSLQALAANDAFIDTMLARLRTVDADGLVGDPAWITHAYLLEELEARVGLRVCKTEVWNVNQMGGWHSGYAQIAQMQPVGTPELREQSLARWSRFAAFVDQEKANLGEGIKLGYTAPKTVVQRVVDQLDGLLALEAERSPFYSPAARDDDAEFAAATRTIVEEQITPALRRYREFLAGPYLERARAALSITANPDGRACYDASLRAYTTLDRSAEDVFELGKKTVEANKASVIELGRSAYELTDFEEILDRVKSDPADRFTSKDELLEFSREMVKRAEAEMPDWVGTMPTQPVVVVPFEEHEEGTGRSAHYRPGNSDRPGEYRIPLHEPEEQSRGGAESIAFHEAWPGHHLQVAFAKAIDGLHPVTELIWFSGPGEGWARYSEALSEEMGLYQSVTGPITRRAWPARGMVVDPGIHLFGWTREEAIDFMMVSGRFPETMGDEMVDRIAILPGQLTAYDSGGLEILALRKQAREQLGEDFDIREFHDRILENGTIPLPALRAHVERWIASKK
ncbi:MAG: DUF885 domain-containing protein [Gammaproteobacteria bacterium]|nr:DUF885 domain-containing protein [Gammaproteobacteria bacterium]MDH5617476.1 DUF885 domain-containing protein [Gammaproteobacteria bacterium]